MDKHVIQSNPLVSDAENRKPSVTVTIKIPFLNSEDNQDC